MKIKGLKHLNSNWYNSIMIRNLGYDDIKIDVRTEKNIETTKKENSFYNNIKKLSDKEKLKEIIRYYLRNNKIYSLSEKTKLDYYDGYFIVIEGSRNLYLQLKKGTLDQEIINEIKEKYKKDRHDYLFNNEINKIEITKRINESSYYIDEYKKSKESVISINLKTKDKKLLNFENEFLEEYINYLFNKTDKKISYRFVGLSVHYIENYDNLTFKEHPGFYVFNDDFILKLDNSLFNYIYSKIEKHNKEIDNCKKLQLNLYDIYKL